MTTKAKTTTTKTAKAKETNVVDTTPVEVQEVEKVETKIEEVKNDQADEIARLQAQIDLLMKAQIAQPSVAPTTSKKSKKKLIKIINLASGGLTLQGSRAIRIPKQFDSVNVTESEASIIVSNMPESARSGLFYIADREFVEENELEDAYNTILDDSQLKTLLSQNVEDVVEIYKNASDAQKSIIDTMIADGRFNGVRIDANILQELGEVSGINFLGIDKIEEV